MTDTTKIVLTSYIVVSATYRILAKFVCALNILSLIACLFIRKLLVASGSVIMVNIHLDHLSDDLNITMCVCCYTFVIIFVVTYRNVESVFRNTKHWRFHRHRKRTIESNNLTPYVFFKEIMSPTPRKKTDARLTPFQCQSHPFQNHHQPIGCFVLYRS